MGCFTRAGSSRWIALLPPLASHDDRFEVHIIQHLLLAMVAPAFLALSAPATLALRTLPRRARRALLRVLHSPAVSMLTAPATGVTLVLGGLFPRGPVLDLDAERARDEAAETERHRPAQEPHAKPNPERN